MTALTRLQPVRGDFLSCYSTAVAGLLRAVGVPDVFALGGQLLLGVRRLGDIPEFLHYHTPLAGDGVLYRVDARRRGAASAAAAAEGLRREAERVGTVIVTGCTTQLPWIKTDGVEPAPHWFLAWPTEPDSDQLFVDDRFTWIDDAGEHEGFAGRLPAAEVGTLAWSPQPVSPEQASRERWAWGDQRCRPDWSNDRPWQWLEVADVRIGGADDVELGRIVLSRTAAGAIVDPGVAGFGWAVGAAAFETLAHLFDEGLTKAATYRCGNDLWVAGRNRLMIAEALRQAELAGVATGLRALGDWVDERLVPAWTTLVRTVRYNTLRVERGTRPRTGILAELRRISALEDEFRARLADALTSHDHHRTAVTDTDHPVAGQGRPTVGAAESRPRGKE